MKPTKKLTPTSPQQTEATAEVIKLGIDIHKTKYVVIRQIDNQAAQSPQSFSPSEIRRGSCRYVYNCLDFSFCGSGGRKRKI
jgi:hypothetical protein